MLVCAGRLKCFSRNDALEGKEGVPAPWFESKQTNCVITFKYCRRWHYTFINHKCLIMAQNIDKPQNPALRKSAVRRSVTITIPLEVAETLQCYIDGGIGSSEDDEFTREMKIVLKRLDRQVSKHYD